ncbi:unnamed protein product [Cuscuta campestris]|uniref:Retroviral polymerase SH3-like domain-containing protein n=1 Tax=Cuscuta campestris TaxID=132261 RepID=A0A484LC89_9ASTE|nr:unnamed protein product [Cuscuta campestris]
MANNNNPFNLRYVLEKEKLSGTNFLDWEMNLKIVRECEKKLYVLTSEPPKAPEANARAAEITSYRKYEDDARDVREMSHASHHDPGAPKAPQGHGSSSYDDSLESTVAKKSGPRSPAGTKRKGSKKPKPASNSSSVKPKEGAKKKSDICYYCGKKGHWRRNYAKLLAERKEGKKPQTSALFVGYPKETRGYEFYHPSDNKIFVARNGTFLKKEFFSAITSGRKVDLEEIRESQEEVPIVLEPEQRDQAIDSQTAQDIPRWSDQIRNPLVRYEFLMSDEGDVLLTWLSENFFMKDLGDASYVLGIRIYRVDQES